MAKKLLLTFYEIRHDHIGKDVTCVPLYLSRALGCTPTIVSLATPANKDMEGEHDGVHYQLLFRAGARLGGLWKIVFFWWFLLRHAREFDIFVRFHYSTHTVLETLIYKWRNPGGKVYIKCDANPRIFNKFRKRGGILKPLLFRKAIAAAKVVSCETQLVYDGMVTSPSPYFAFGDKLILVHNGFDEGMFSRTGIVPRPWEQKEKLMITVARLGSKDKNTEMLLEALAATDLKEWQFHLVGPFEGRFGEQVERFYTDHPEKRGSVVFTGPVYDKKALWEIYDRARVFVLTSRKEGYAIVYGEAKRFGEYVVTTDVGGARETVGDNRFGEYIPQEDSTALAAALQHIVDGQTDTNVYGDYDPQQLSWEHCLRPVIDKLEA